MCCFYWLLCCRYCFSSACKKWRKKRLLMVLDTLKKNWENLVVMFIRHRQTSFFLSHIWIMMKYVISRLKREFTFLHIWWIVFLYLRRKIMNILFNVWKKSWKEANKLPFWWICKIIFCIIRNGVFLWAWILHVIICRDVCHPLWIVL